ncbi:MAG: DUF4402 domain-containing protein [Bacteroidota bacterium]
MTVLFFCFSSSFAQPGLPPRSITVISTQALDFGRVCDAGQGGTVTVGWDGSRTSTGSVALLASPTPMPAIFEIKLCQGRNVIITFASTTILTGSNGGSLILDIGPTEYGGNNVRFPTKGDCSFITPLRVGGTLHIPGTVILGTYSGSFEVTFNQE